MIILPPDRPPFAVVIQYYHGDEPAALSLARLLADVERERRDDVQLVLSRYSDTPASAELHATARYCGRKFQVKTLCPPGLPDLGYPGECHRIWAATARLMAEAYLDGDSPFGSFLMAEADGCPTSLDWLERVRKAHEETVLRGKLITGPVMRFPNFHVNGTMAIEARLVIDFPSLLRCPPQAGWDCFHGATLLANCNPYSRIIENLYGYAEMSESAFWTVAREAAWVTSVKDGLHHFWARKMLTKSSPWRNPNEKGRIYHA